MAIRKKTYRKRNNFRKKKNTRRRHKLVPSMNPMKSAFPSNRVVKLKYVETFTIDVPAATAFNEYVFSANSIFDPNVTAAGHQPYGRDQWLLFYKQYVVLGSKISVQGIVETSSNSAIYGVKCTDLATTGHTTIAGLMEAPGISYRFIQTAVNGNVPRPAVAHFSAKKWFNVSDVKDNKTRIGAAMTASPAEQAYFTVFLGPHDGTTDIPAYRFVATIQYIVLLSEPKELPQS